MTEIIGGPPDPKRPDGRQSPAALDIARGTSRALKAHGFACLAELPLASGRRADLACLSEKGDVWIVEIKSNKADFRSDQKWRDYLDYCDRFFFAVAPDFPQEILPDDCGLIVADRFGAEILRDAPLEKLAAARRKAMTLRIARQAALRLQTINDPDGVL